jgi:hypothetical protein
MAIWTNRISGSIPKSAADQVKLLVEYADRLGEFIDAAQEQQPALTANEVIVAIAKDIRIDSKILESVFNALDNIKNLSDEFGGIEKTIDELSRGLKDEDAQKILKKKHAISEAVTKYTSDNAIAISYKAQRLTYLRENTFQEAEIITDARPVFDSKGENIIEYLITHYLVVTYFHQGDFKNIHLAMDAGDVVKLRKACDRAFVKAKSLKAALGDKARILRDDNANST